MPQRVYLDWNATTPLRTEARDAVVAALETCGNPSSVHAEGRKARKILQDARAAVAASLEAAPDNVVFTSGATEANVLALVPGLHRAPAQPVERLIVSAIEHASVLSGGRFRQEFIEVAPVDRSGVIDLTALDGLLADEPPALVSVMLANNETGVVQPIRDVAELVRAHGGVLHVDAVAAFGRIDFDFNALDVDLLSISAHKIGGPKGVGALLVAEDLRGLRPLITGVVRKRDAAPGPRTCRGSPGWALRRKQPRPAATTSRATVTPCGGGWRPG